jgi:hypothetical protein
MRTSSLLPLRWCADEPLVYDPASNELHRRGCALAVGSELIESEVFELVWAPLVCAACRPDVTMGLSSSRPAGARAAASLCGGPGHPR